jgi:hypothetical protein
VKSQRAFLKLYFPADIGLLCHDKIIFMKQVNATITTAELRKMAEKMYGNLVKAVVDIANQALVVDAEMHVDEEQYLLQNGSLQQNLWGINLYPDNFGNDSFVEFDSMINIRPSAKNFNRGVDSKDIRDKILKIVKDKVVE